MTTLTFDGSHSGNVVTTGGYVFTATADDPSNDNGHMIEGTGELDFNYRHVTLTITAANGSAFNLASFDVDGNTPGGGGEGVGIYQAFYVTAQYADGSSNAFDYQFNNSAGFETVNADLSNVVSVTISPFSYYAVNGLRVDNVVVSPIDTSVITFTGAGWSGDGSATDPNKAHQFGYTFQVDPNSSGDNDLYNGAVRFSGDRGTGDYAQISIGYGSSTFTKDDGGTFGVASVDLDAWFNYGAGSGESLHETFTADFLDGHHESFSLDLDEDDGFQTILMPASFGSNLVALHISAPGHNNLLIDNIKLGASLLPLNGTNGNDVINGVQSGAAIDGKKGTDTVDFGTATGSVNGNLATGTGQGGGANVTLVNVENLTGGGYDDTLTGNGAANVLIGAAGDDDLFGGAGKDALYGGAGSDFLDGGAAADVMAGGAGGDGYIVDNAADVVTEAVGEGFDVVTTSVTWTATAGSEIELIALSGSGNISATGNVYTQEIDGNAGNNTLSDGGGAVVLKGGAGNDTYVITNAGTTVQEDAAGGSDSIKVSLDTFVLPANIEKVTYTGASNFHATGTGGAETINGGAGDDILNGGGGADHLTGGLGADTFVVGAAVAGGLVINDFQAGIDKIDVAFAAGADFVLGANGAGGTAGHATISYDTNSGKLYWEADGMAAHKVLLASLTAHLDLHAADFIFGGP